MLNPMKSIFLWEDMTRLIFKVYHSKVPKHVRTGCLMCEKIMYSCYVSNELFYSLLFLEWALCEWNDYKKPFLPSQGKGLVFNPYSYNPKASL